MQTPDKFSAKLIPLLEMEKEAEVTQSKEAISKGTPESGQKRGVFLLNLRLEDMEPGLMGRTLLTL